MDANINLDAFNKGTTAAKALAPEAAENRGQNNTNRGALRVCMIFLESRLFKIPDDDMYVTAFTNAAARPEVSTDAPTSRRISESEYGAYEEEADAEAAEKADGSTEIVWSKTMGPGRSPVLAAATAEIREATATKARTGRDPIAGLSSSSSSSSSSGRRRCGAIRIAGRGISRRGRRRRAAPDRPPLRSVVVVVVAPIGREKFAFPPERKPNAAAALPSTEGADAALAAAAHPRFENISVSVVAARAYAEGATRERRGGTTAPTRRSAIASRDLPRDLFVIAIRTMD